MRILIYSMSENASKLRGELREARHSVYLRNPDTFSTAPGEFEVADEVYTDSGDIKKVYENRKIRVHPLTKKAAPKKRTATKKKVT